MRAKSAIIGRSGMVEPGQDVEEVLSRELDLWHHSISGKKIATQSEKCKGVTYAVWGSRILEHYPRWFASNYPDFGLLI